MFTLNELNIIEKFSADTLFDEMNKCNVTREHKTAVIVYKQSCFTKELPEKSRSYSSHSNQWGWNYNLMGRQRLGDCLDGTEKNVRLDWFDGEIEYWYWKEDE